MQQCAQRTGMIGDPDCLFELPQYFRFAQHHGIEPRSYAKGMLDGILLRQGIHVRLDVDGL
jgi:hypothetical protein